MMIVAGMILAWAVLLIAPGTPIARALAALIVVAPARLLNRIGRGQVLVALLAALVVGAAVLILDGEAARLLAMAAPDVLAWATMVDLAAVLDAAVATTLLAGSVKWRAVRSLIAGKLRRPRPRARRNRGAAVVHKPANDDDRPAWARAA